MAVFAQRKHAIPPEDYLEIERAAEHKSEYLNGEMWAMAGAGRRHNKIVLNTGSALHYKLKERTCSVYVNEMRVNIRASGL